jgi:hypothetical protein
MSLLQLLTTGRCLEGHKDSEPRYRLTSQRLLPKFGSDRNPFCAKEAATPPTLPGEATERNAVVTPEPEAVATTRAFRRDPAVRSAVAAPGPAAARASAKGWGIISALRVRTTGFRKNWAGKLHGLLSRPARKPMRMALPLATKPAVQGELSLDRIKVVRNDLSDADLEVVGAKPSPLAAVNAPAPRSAERAESGALAWRRLAARVCGVDKR